MRTNILIGLAVAAALTGGVANAAITMPGNNVGEVIELVVDNNNGNVYARGTQISFNTVLPSVLSTTAYNASTPPVATGFTFTPIAADPHLQTFLAQNGGHDSFSYALLSGGVNLGGGTPALGSNKPGGNVIEFTSLNTLAAGNLTALSGTAISSAVGSLQGDLPTMNGIIGGNAGDGTSADISTQFNGNTSPMFQLYGNNTPILANLGQNMNLYAMTGNSSAAAFGQVYTAGLLTITPTGTLEAAGAPVPLPAAIWLLGSGLLGLAGIGRRRLSA